MRSNILKAGLVIFGLYHLACGEATGGSSNLGTNQDWQLVGVQCNGVDSNLYDRNGRTANSNGVSLVDPIPYYYSNNSESYMLLQETNNASNSRYCNQNGPATAVYRQRN